MLISVHYKGDAIEILSYESNQSDNSNENIVSQDDVKCNECDKLRT